MAGVAVAGTESFCSQIRKLRLDEMLKVSEPVRGADSVLLTRRTCGLSTLPVAPQTG